MERYAIYEGHMADLMKKITKIQNKCLKYGCEFHIRQMKNAGYKVKEIENNA